MANEGKPTDESTMTSGSPKRRKFKLFQRSNVKRSKTIPQSTPKDLSPPMEISVHQQDTSSDVKANPRQLFPQKFAHDQILKCKLIMSS